MGGPEAQDWLNTLPFCSQAIRSLSLSPKLEREDSWLGQKQGPSLSGFISWGTE